MNSLGGYESPVKVYQLIDDQYSLENEVFKVVRSMSVDVDKEELLKALAYDRNQYKEGYEAGYNKAYQEMHDKFFNFTVNMRPATPEERQSIKESLDKISTPTGINIWNLFENKGGETNEACI